MRWLAEIVEDKALSNTIASLCEIKAQTLLTLYLFALFIDVYLINRRFLIKGGQING